MDRFRVTITGKTGINQYYDCYGKDEADARKMALEMSAIDEIESPAIAWVVRETRTHQMQNLST